MKAKVFAKHGFKTTLQMHLLYSDIEDNSNLYPFRHLL